jgi:hypothetical protein
MSINLIIEKLVAFIEFMIGYQPNILGRSEKEDSRQLEPDGQPATDSSENSRKNAKITLMGLTSPDFSTKCSKRPNRGTRNPGK